MISRQPRFRSFLQVINFSTHLYQRSSPDIRKNTLSGVWYLAAAALLSALGACSPVSTPIPPTYSPSPTLTWTYAVPSANGERQPTRTPPTNPTATASPSPLPSPLATRTPLPKTCQEKSGAFETGELTSSLLRHPLDYRIWLPPCYGEDATRRYPVLYLIHGQSSTDEQWERLGAGDVAGELVSSGHIPPFLIVMPRDRVWSQPTEDNFGRVVAEELIPWIDSRYATLPERAYRAVGGLSRGAGWAVHLGLSKWELFGAIGAHSLPVFWTDTYYIKSWLSGIPAEDLPRIYMDIGDKDRPEIMNSAVWFEELLTSLSIPHEWYLYPGYHEEAYWSGNLERYLRWYSKGWEQSDLER